MEKIDNEYYVSLEVAKMLKEAGFNWECRKIHFCYVEDDHMWNLEDNHKQARRILKLDYCLLAPTLEVAQRWLREVKGWEAQVAYGFDEDGHKTYVTECGNPEGDLENYIVYFPTYEEAQEAGIKKALELILEKGE